MRRMLIAIVVVIAFLASTTLSVLTLPSAAQAPIMGPMADELRFIEIVDEAVAIQDLEAGGSDIRRDPFRTPEQLAAALASPDLSHARASAVFWNLAMNSVPRSDGVFNPMAIREIREAMNWLIDRQFILDETYGGQGRPMVTFFTPTSPDYGRFAGFIAGLEAKYAHDAAKAGAIITDAMNGAGATLVNGKWQHGGADVTMTFLIRIDDSRRTAWGGLLATQLEDLGFTIIRDFKDSGAASLQRAFPASDGVWQLYTGGWGSSVLTLWSRWSGYQMFRYIPSSNIWNERSVPADCAAALDNWWLQNFESEAERAVLIEKSLECTLEDSTRVWIVLEEAVYSFRNDIEAVFGLATGMTDLLTGRSARRDGQVGGIITMSQKQGWTGPGWNPSGVGSNWAYDRAMERQYRDYGVWVHPHTGKAMPIRATWDVETAGPLGELDMPDDAIFWNMANASWETVALDATAVSKVTYTYEMGNFHHGMPVTMADVLNAVSVTYRLGDPLGDAFTAIHASPYAFFFSIFKGLRVVGDMATSNEVEVYIDNWHWDEGEIAGFGDIFPNTPWEVWEVLLKAYVDSSGADGVAFDEDEALDLGRTWMNQAFGPSVPFLKTAFDTLKADNTIPVGLTGLVTDVEATARYDALGAWYTANQAAGNAFLVSNGPFYLDSVHIPTKTTILKADRANYPLAATIWDDILQVRIPEIALGAAPDITLGVAAAFPIAVTLFGVPYDQVTLNWIILDPATAEILLSGEAVRVGTGAFEARLSGVDTLLLQPGSYELRVIGVGADAAPPTIVRQSFLVFSVASVLETLIKATEAALKDDLGGLTGRINTVDETTSALAADIAGLSALITLVLVLAVVAIATSAIGVVVLIRRTPPGA